MTEKRCDNCVWQSPNVRDMRSEKDKRAGKSTAMVKIEWICINSDSERYGQVTSDDIACECWK